MSPPKPSQGPRPPSFKRGWSTPQLTRIEGCPDRSDLKAGMAFFADTGPFGETCGNCKHLDGKKGLARCMMFRKLTGRLGEYIEKNYRACRYFEGKPKKPSIVAPARKHSTGISPGEAELLRKLNNRPPPHLK